MLSAMFQMRLFLLAVVVSWWEVNIVSQSFRTEVFRPQDAVHWYWWVLKSIWGSVISILKNGLRRIHQFMAYGRVCLDIFQFYIWIFGHLLDVM